MILYAKAPFGTPATVIEYLGRYTHKIAITKHRIVSVTDRHVTFTYKAKEKEHVFYLINPNTFLLDGIYSPESNMYTILANYKVIDGYLIPTYIASMNDGVIYAWVIYKDIKFNQPIDKDIFNYPR